MILSPTCVHNRSIDRKKNDGVISMHKWIKISFYGPRANRPFRKKERNAPRGC